MSRLANTLALAGCLTVFALVGCNAVLGIDEAQLAADFVGKVFVPDKNPDTSPVPQFAEECDAPTSACATCQADDCGPLKSECLKDPKCRFALDAYRSCLSNPCSDANGECLGALAKLESSSGFGFANCVKNICPTECRGSLLVSPCEEYCGCMTQNCTEQLEAFGSDFDACLAACNKVEPAAILCRWTHCEMAPTQKSGGHCLHALGQSGRCTATTAAQPNCTDRSQNDFICAKGTDCCSDYCNGVFCEANQ